MDSKKEIQHVYLVGAKSLGAYGGYETFVYKLTEYHQNKENIKYHVACKANGDGCMDETKFDGVTKINDHEFEFHNAHCFKIDVPQIGPAQAIYYDVAALKACCEHIKKWHKKKNTRLGERIQKIFSTRRVFHSAGMCLLEAEGFYPCGQVGFAGIGIEHLAMQQFCTGAARSKLFIGLAHVAAARCGKGDDCFTLQIIAFQKCIDDRRSNIPPDRESDKDGVVFVHVITLGSDGRARGRIAHFDGAAGFLVHPVQIGLGVRNFRLNLKNVCTDSIGKIFSNLCGNAAGGEVSNKSFAHDKCTSFD